MNNKVTNRCCGRCDGVHDECVSDMFCHDHHIMGCIECFGPIGNIITPKLNSDDEIIVKDKWNRKEVVDLFYDFALYKTSLNIDQVNEWLNKNLK